MSRHRLIGALAVEKGEYDTAEEHLKRAVMLTMGEVEQIFSEERLLAELELETLILYAQALQKREKVCQARNLSESISGYVAKRISDSEAEAKIRSKIAVVLGSIYNEAGEYDACANLCGRALELLRDNDLTQCMPSLLALLAEAYEQTGRQEEARRMFCMAG